MLIVCKKCGVEHDSRDVVDGVCFWCEQKENDATVFLQFAQSSEWNKQVIKMKSRGKNG